MTSSADLYGLQEVDLRRDHHRALIADIESRLVETPELLEAREEAADAEAQADRLRKEQRELEAQLQALDARVGPLETKLYSGEIRNPKELSDLQKEVELLKAQRSKMDDEVLSSLEVLEIATASAREAKDEAARIEAEWIAGQSTLRSNKAVAEEELTRLDGDRNVRIQGMDRNMLGLYENLRKVKNGRAVARLDRGNCLGCNVSLPTNMVSRVRQGDMLIQCPRCERILVAG
jgi:predicted  nucleic acid-binding Zn-ribbon protein